MFRVGLSEMKETEGEWSEMEENDRGGRDKCRMKAKEGNVAKMGVPI
jgi:hypothetical protein